MANPDFRGSGNPAVAVIHNDIIPAFHLAMGGTAPDPDPVSALMGAWEAYLEAMDEANEEFGKAVDSAMDARTTAQLMAQAAMEVALSRWASG